jgi:hypothetical protein
LRPSVDASLTPTPHTHPTPPNPHPLPALCAAMAYMVMEMQLPSVARYYGGRFRRFWRFRRCEGGMIGFFVC